MYSMTLEDQGNIEERMEGKSYLAAGQVEDLTEGRWLLRVPWIWWFTL